MTNENRAVTIRNLVDNTVHNTTVLAGSSLYDSLIAVGRIKPFHTLFDLDGPIPRNYIVDENCHVVAAGSRDPMLRVYIGNEQGEYRESFVPENTTFGALCRYTCMPYRKTMSVTTPSGQNIFNPEDIASSKAYNAKIEHMGYYVLKNAS